MEKALYLFGDIVVVEKDLIGVVVKTWEQVHKGNHTEPRHKSKYYYEVYVRNYRIIKDYDESEIERYRVRHKKLDEQELEWQNA